MMAMKAITNPKLSLNAGLTCLANTRHMTAKKPFVPAPLEGEERRK